MSLPHIAIISSSVRKERNSHRVALFFNQYLNYGKLATAEVIDLEVLDFPLFEERIPFQENPPAALLEFSQKVKTADGVIIVTPEYNGGYPASLKNAIDVLTDEWRRKPVAISTVSDGPFGGSQVLVALQFVLWKMGAWTVPALHPVAEVEEVYSEQGIPADPPKAEKRASRFIMELLWCIEAGKRMKNS
ncbi:MAG: NAD(P)H-dependent oxidoreductase [Bacteroidales bacterium]|nr:NAD(P)H-dependent oxidoreductase [Bacteroidales bacterium]